MKKSLVILFSFILINSFFISGIYAQDISATDTNVAENNLPVEVPENTLASSVGYVSPEGEVVSTSDEDDKFNTLVEEAKEFDEELSVDAGITPDSGLYFVEDKILAPFRDDSVNRERKIAEMRELAPRCGQGEQSACDNMRKSFERYQRYADNFERDVSPEERERALESSRAIRGTFIRDIAQNVPAGQKDEFVRDIVLGEDNIAIAAEIAGKIKELCQQLSKLDSNEYARVCSSGEDAPDWRKRLDRELTDEQRQEALKFGNIMSQCFETAGQNCRCEEISFPDFAEACSTAAPLATACDIKGDEEACKQLDALEMPELPEHLQDIMDELEGGMNEDKYGMFFPPECEEANARTPRECAKIMINTHAPEECRQALLDADVQSEREGREICDKIMFEVNAPPECVSAGITNPKECGKFMFAQNAPLECVEAGITGEGRDDPRKCQQLMESKFRPQGEFGGPSCAPGTICVPGSQWAPGTGPNRQMSGGNCAGISNSEERLKCYDGAGNFVQEYRDDFRGKFEDMQNKRRQCEESCRAQGEGGFLKENGNCVCEPPNYQEYGQQYPNQFRQDFDEQPKYNPYGDFKGGQYFPPEGQPGQFQPPQGMMPPGDYSQYNQPNQQQPSYPQPPEGYQYPQPPQDYQQYNQQPPTTSTEPTTSGAEPYSMGGSAEPTTSTSTTSSGGDTSTSTSTSSGGDSGGTTSSGGDSGGSVTGGVISNNKFLRFWFWR